jgi:hypothetical protein
VIDSKLRIACEDTSYGIKKISPRRDFVLFSRCLLLP